MKNAFYKIYKNEQFKKDYIASQKKINDAFNELVREVEGKKQFHYLTAIR